MSELKAECGACHAVKFCPYLARDGEDICCDCVNKAFTEYMDSYELGGKQRTGLQKSPEWRRKVDAVLQAMQSFTEWLKKKKPGVIEEDGKK